MIIAITGARLFVPTVAELDRTLLPLFQVSNPTHVVHGGAIGVDTAVSKYAKSHCIKQTCIRPDYAQYGRRAPLVRNREIIDKTLKLAKTHGVDCVCFALLAKNSKGTRYTINLANDAKMRTIVYSIGESGVSNARF